MKLNCSISSEPLQMVMISTKEYLLGISAIFLLAATIRIICFVGLIGSDDLTYNRSAYDIATGAFSTQLSHQRTRIGLLLPVAGMFKVFGVNEQSSIAFSFLYFLMTLGFLIYTGTIYFGKWPGIIAGLLYTFLPIEIFHPTMLLPDFPSAACIALSGSILYHVDRHAMTTIPCQSQNTRITHAKTYGYIFLGGIALGWAYLIKETALFFGVFVIGYMGYKTFIGKTFQRSWLWFWAGFLLIIGAELCYYYWVTGNPLYRYFTIEFGHNLSKLALRDRVYGLALLRRLTLDQFLVLFHVPDFGFYYFFVLAGIIYGIQKHIICLYYFIGWFLTFFLLFNFASTSLLEYYPIRPIPRYFITLSFPGLIIMSFYLVEFKNFLLIKHEKDMTFFRVSLLIPFMLMFVMNLLWFSVATTMFLLCMFFLLLMSFFNRLRTWFGKRLTPWQKQVILPLMLLYIAILPGIYTVAKAERPRQGITCERDIRPLLEFPLTHTIYTDTRTESILEYYYEYQYDDYIKNFDESDVTTREDVYVIANWKRLLFLNRLYNTTIPEFLHQPPRHWKPYARIGDDVNPCLIYKIP